MQNKFLQIKKAKNHEYYYAERLGIDSIAFVLFDRQKGYGLIKEFKPPIDEFVITAFGGSIDKDKSLLEIVKDEVKEEAGYTVLDCDILYRGKRFVSTQMNQFCHLYLVDVSGLIPGEKEPETYLESIAKVVWLKYRDVISLDFLDWKAQAIIATEGGLRV